MLIFLLDSGLEQWEGRYYGPLHSYIICSLSLVIGDDESELTKMIARSSEESDSV